jgi:glutaryl-CoA dehydrogenase (non-decarboxylating)
MILTDEQRACRDAARGFATTIAQWAPLIDREQTTPPAVLDTIRDSGYLGASLPAEWGGGAMDAVSYGLVTEEIGSVCSSMRSLLTVHNMSAQAVEQFGTPKQRARWLPDLSTGRKIMGFALTESEAGTATNSIQTRVRLSGGTFVLDGIKKWITYGLVADQFLVFARLGDEHVALVVDRETDGLSIEPLGDMLGTRGSMLAELRFEGAKIDRDALIGRAGAGIRFVANAALDHGRFSVAWGSAGIIRACLDACLEYASTRSVGDTRLRDYQLIRRQVTDMLVAHTVSRAMCHRCACLRDQRDPRSLMETSLAKYHASTAAIEVATNAVQLFGANGCSPAHPVSRYMRDAMIAGVVEGTREIHQLTLADYAYQRPYLD